MNAPFDQPARLCKDCKHMIRASFLMRLGSGHRYDKCGKTINAGSGEPQSFCIMERDPFYDDIGTRCTSKGLWFEPKEGKK